MQRFILTALLASFTVACTSSTLLSSAALAQDSTIKRADSGAAASINQDEKRAKGLPVGLNDPFLDPKMDVDRFLERFEVESREVFANRMRIVEELQLETGMAVADVGAGTGPFLSPLSEAVGKEGSVFAIDISPQFLKYLRQRTKAEKLDNSKVIMCSDRDVRLPADSVDRVLICDVYHHFEYPQSSLASIMRALRPGGKMVIVDFERIEGKSRPWLLNHVRASKEQFTKEIVDAGFELECEVEVKEFKETYLLRFVKPL